MSRAQDIASLLRSLQLVTEQSVKLQCQSINQIWKHSSLRCSNGSCASTLKSVADTKSIDIGSTGKETLERISAVVQGLRAYAGARLPADHTVNNEAHVETKPEQPHSEEQRTVHKHIREDKEKSKKPEFTIKLTDSDKALLRKLDMEHRARMTEKGRLQQEKDVKSEVEDTQVKSQQAEEENAQETKVSSIPNPKSKQKLSENAKQRKVPSTRLGRMVSFGTLAAGLGLGTAAEYAKRTLGIGEAEPDASTLFLNKANMERIADTLCKVRGAALKLGQILSIQDESIINPELAKALERVRKSADFMPNWQVEQVMSQELGFGWRTYFTEFEEKPFAAASIGQVHRGTLIDGRDVAVKIQYPGVAKGINSDIENLAAIMKMWNIFPKGMFLDNLMVVAKRELAWEVDYVRESECTKKFKNILEPYKEYYVPTVIETLSTKHVFTTELLDGIPVDQCLDLGLEHREYIGSKIMELCLLEILKFRYMQTDPNWANFLYNAEKKQLLLLDFGASREYSKPFMDQYVRILKAACDGDRNTVLNVSKDLGFLTGYESKVMEEAHVNAVMILGEVFRKKGKYDFGHQDMTRRIQNLAQIMLTHRLCPPPEEVYSLHRKLSGVFLLCSKLNITVDCRQHFIRLYDEYVFG
ncbi:unnamed protein product [Acanthoscelides obtectus]|uniref:ABC1 atypical kinase-like domain-containing protein n=1 Tax=Acanthoscelides obtectus TaxID=200917 RepID=A0A9P0P1R7_ACAOB|nr:unnamed protein product [Acanthoscelides obtectus]CAK1639416.1 Atypical kinase COQ8B, mitochondrial [Acanthoscelides obtectus]